MNLRRRYGSRVRLPVAQLAKSFTLLFALSGCGMGDDASTPVGISVAYRDSAGVQIVENHTPAWQPGQAWILEEDYTIRSGTGDSEAAPPLYAVVGVQQVNDDQVVVANAGSDQLIWYDAEGQFIRAAGGDGEGPGEFHRMYSLSRCAGDTLAVQELRRVSFWGPNGKFVRTTSLVPRATNTASLRMEGVSADCSALLIRGQSSTGSLQLGVIERPTYSLFWERHSDGQRDTLAVGLPWAEFFGGVFDGSLEAIVRPWGLISVWAPSASGVYVGRADRAEVREVASGGQVVRIVRWDRARDPVTSADRRLYEEARANYLKDKPSYFGDFYVDLADAPVPTLKPAYSRLLVDTQGNLWVMSYPSVVAAGRFDLEWGLRDAPQEWTVFDSHGRLLGTVSVPERYEVLSIFDTHVATIWKDQWDVEEIRFLRIVK